MMSSTVFVGPILMSGEIADAIIVAIRRLNCDVNVQDRGAYLRVSVPKRCILMQETIESALGHPFVFPGDLEKVLLSSQGTLTMTRQKAVWQTTKGEKSFD